MTDVLVIGAGPAGVLAALRAADLGAQTFAHAGRLMREARQLGQYGVKVSEPVLDYSRLLARVREVVNEVCTHSSLRQTSVNRASQAASRNRPQQRERPINGRSLSNLTIERELDRSCKT